MSSEHPAWGTVEHDRLQFLHLTRVTWDLRMLGVDVMLDADPTCEPVVYVMREPERLRVNAELRDGRWVFAWGRSGGRHVGVDDDAALTIFNAS